MAKCRVELVADAVVDLENLARGGNLRQFLRKLVWLEANGKDAGEPLRFDLTGLRKIVVGNRNWRIIFKMSVDESVATVWVIGDRDDSACYEEALRRLRHAQTQRTDIQGFAEVLLGIIEQQAQRRRKK